MDPAPWIQNLFWDGRGTIPSQDSPNHMQFDETETGISGEKTVVWLG